MNDNYITTLADAYVTAYMRVMEKSGNINFAIQTAMSICLVLDMNYQNKQQNQENAMSVLMTAILNQINQCKTQEQDVKEGDEEDDE